MDGEVDNWHARCPCMMNQHALNSRTVWLLAMLWWSHDVTNPLRHLNACAAMFPFIHFLATTFARARMLTHTHTLPNSSHSHTHHTLSHPHAHTHINSSTDTSNPHLLCDGRLSHLLCSNLSHGHILGQCKLSPTVSLSPCSNVHRKGVYLV